MSKEEIKLYTIVGIHDDVHVEGKWYSGVPFECALIGRKGTPIPYTQGIKDYKGGAKQKINFKRAENALRELFTLKQAESFYDSMSSPNRYNLIKDLKIIEVPLPIENTRVGFHDREKQGKVMCILNRGSVGRWEQLGFCDVKLSKNFTAEKPWYDYD